MTLPDDATLVLGVRFDALLAFVGASTQLAPHLQRLWSRRSGWQSQPSPRMWLLRLQAKDSERHNQLFDHLAENLCVKKAPTNEKQTAKPLRRGRPSGDVPPVPNAERQRAHRLRLKDEGKQVLHLALLPQVVHKLDLLRGDGSSREDVVERLVKAEMQRKKR